MESEKLPDGIQVGDDLLHEYFRIGTQSTSAGIPFPEEPNLEAHFGSSSPYGASLGLYDNSEDLKPYERPRLGIEANVFESMRDLILSVEGAIPEDHLLIRNRRRIIDRCKFASEEMGLSFINQFYIGYDAETLARAISETFNSTASEVLKRDVGIEDRTLSWQSRYLGLADISSFREFKRQGIRFLLNVGLTATATEKLKFLRTWSEKLAEKGIIPKNIMQDSH